MSLTFYSSEYYPENIKIDEFIFDKFKKSPQITFIPSFHYDSHSDFRYFVESYKKLGVKKFIHFPIEVNFSQTLEDIALGSDIIHLAGGNTFYFLKQLKRKKFLGKLKKFYANGGSIHGVSAGGIILTPSIDMASVPNFDRDENNVKLVDWSALKMVDFHFFPHFKNSKRYTDPLLKFSRKSNKPIIACCDGGGIVQNSKDEQKLFGRVFLIENGKKTRLN